MMRRKMKARTSEVAPGVHWLPLRGANVYFVRSAGSWVLIDAGFGSSARVISDAAAQLCGPAGQPGTILVTHGHPDHMGAAVELAATWGVPIMMPAGEMPYVNGTALYPEPFVALLERVLPQSFMRKLIRGSDRGEAVRPFDPEGPVPGLPDWKGIATPGHTPGHTAFFRPEDRTLICGDAILTMAWSSRLGGRGLGWLGDLARGRTKLTGPPSGFTCDWSEAAASIDRLAELEPLVLATGHGAPLSGPSVALLLNDFLQSLPISARGPARTSW